MNIMLIFYRMHKDGAFILYKKPFPKERRLYKVQRGSGLRPKES